MQKPGRPCLFRVNEERLGVDRAASRLGRVAGARCEVIVTTATIARFELPLWRHASDVGGVFDLCRFVLKATDARPTLPRFRDERVSMGLLRGACPPRRAFDGRRFTASAAALFPDANRSTFASLSSQTLVGLEGTFHTSDGPPRRENGRPAASSVPVSFRAC